MGFIGVILLVAFVIICVLLICLVMVQDDGSGVGGIFGGSNSAAFGSRSGSVLTRTTYVFVALFFITTFALALLNKAPAVKQLDAAAAQVEGASGDAKPWLDADTEEPDGASADAVPEEAGAE
ncbi:preprotein translocase subunit SecG [Treponema endosymbiont of Eucomonympha sp.]|uniref:preprotein translocase subunit SecG n=1 Tax=Treponema endosymbiont of Eucomonympha sp. TaxID=1580831 RepID=UPI0007817DD2|nr:preprotein translocase subunit SecG [Treponema endosymbiont of Eucomonympha sp.]